MASSSKLIKDTEAYGLQSLRTFSMQDIEEERRRIIAAAEKDAAEVRALAQEILAQAKTALAAIRAQADSMMADADKRGFENGYAQGLEKGREDGGKAAYEAESRRVRENTASLADRLAQIASAVESERAAVTARAHNDLLLFALAVARKIVKREVNLSQDVIRENLKKAIELVAEKSDLRVRINPAESETVEEFVPQLKSAFTKLKSIKLVPDMNVSPGGCVVQTRGGEVDARIETQLAEIERQLLEI